LFERPVLKSIKEERYRVTELQFMNKNVSKPARYWIFTAAHHVFTPYLPAGVAYTKGQLELGANGFLHWQFISAFETAVRLSAVRKLYGDIHAEPCKSDAADDYVWKDDTAVEGTRFELGTKKLRKNSKRDWDEIKQLAIEGRMSEIDAGTFVTHYRTLRAIGTDNLVAPALERKVNVYWGETGTGKSRRAWAEAGLTAFPKDSRSKFWCGYQGQENVVMDEFRGGVDIGHMLRWLDRYPVIVEVKGGAVALNATRFWITSNIDPRLWYPDCDAETVKALMRRLDVTHFQNPFGL
jgi:hypothetical protein